MEDHHQEYFNDATQNMKDGEVQYEDPAIGGGESQEIQSVLN